MRPPGTQRRGGYIAVAGMGYISACRDFLRFARRDIDKAYSHLTDLAIFMRNGFPSGGIGLGAGLVSHNVADENWIGITIFRAGSASYNLVSRNLNEGLSFGFVVGASYIGNVISGNGTNLSGGVNLGQNLCDFAVCPGASF